MGTLILLHRIWFTHPVVAVAIRDESPWRPVGHPQYISTGSFAPLDVTSGGTWFGVNHHGLLVGVLPRYTGSPPSVGGSPGRYLSLGRLVKECLNCRTASEASIMVCDLKQRMFHDFYLAVADQKQITVVQQDGHRIFANLLKPGVCVVTEEGFTSGQSKRVATVMKAIGHMGPPRPPSLEEMLVWSQMHTNDGSMSCDTDHVCRHSDHYGFESTATSVAVLNRDSWSFRHRQGRPCLTAQEIYDDVVNLQQPTKEGA